MLRTTASLVILTLVFFPAVGVWGGPPAICQPIDIGKAHSLPFGKGAFDTGKLSLDRVVPETLRILEKTDDALVHIETLRRAAIYLKESQVEVDRLCNALKKQIDNEPQKTSEERLGLYWFDLGYLQGALGQLRRKWSHAREFPVVGCFEKAVSLKRDNGAVYFGAALASWNEEPQIMVHRFYAKALRLSKDPDGLLRKNLLVAGRRFFGAGSYKELVAKMEARL